MSDNTQKLYAGQFTAGGELENSEGKFFLSAAENEGSFAELKAMPFPTALEREGQFALIKARKNGKVLWDCDLIEALDPISSRLLDRLLEDIPGLRGQLVNIIRESRDELIGTPVVEADPEQDPLVVVPSGPKPICALVVGHRKSARGAESRLDGTRITEFGFNSELAAMIEERCQHAEVLVVFRDNTASGRAKLPGVLVQRKWGFCGFSLTEFLGLSGLSFWPLARQW